MKPTQYLKTNKKERDHFTMQEWMVFAEVKQCQEITFYSLKIKPLSFSSLSKGVLLQGSNDCNSVATLQPVMKSEMLTETHVSSYRTVNRTVMLFSSFQFKSRCTFFPEGNSWTYTMLLTYEMSVG